MLLGGLLLVVAALWLAPTIAAFLANIDFEGVDRPYLVISGFIVLDAVIPIFPSESLLTTASNLAAQDGSSIEFWRLIVAGTVGATVGDSLLYWLSRTVLRRSMADRVARAEQNEKLAQSLQVLRTNASQLILFGRFVPGVRFLVGATMGPTRYPFRRFLVWDALGGFSWASFKCVFSFLVASVLDDKPILSIAISVVVTTALLALLYKPLKRSREQAALESTSEAELSPPPME